MAVEIETTADYETGVSRYIFLRRKWHPYLAELTRYMAYDWADIAPYEK